MSEPTEADRAKVMKILHGFRWMGVVETREDGSLEPAPRRDDLPDRIARAIAEARQGAPRSIEIKEVDPRGATRL